MHDIPPQKVTSASPSERREGDPGLHQPPAGIDALLPDQIAAKAELSGAYKARMPVVSLFTLATLAGAFVAFGALFALTVTAGTARDAEAFGRVLGGFAFSLALVLVIVGGAELFTSNNLMVMALVGRRISLFELLRAWVVVYLGNLAGAMATGAMAVLAGLSVRDGGAIGAKATSVATGMARLDTLETFFAGVLGNVLVCLAVWISYSGRSTTDRILAVVPPIVAFYALGLEHVIATMFYFPFAYFHALADGRGVATLTFAGSDGTTIGTAAFFGHLLPVTIGNIVGGGLLVGAVYWFVYLRGRGARP